MTVPVNPTTTAPCVASRPPTTPITRPATRVFQPLPPVAFVARYPVRVTARALVRTGRTERGISGATLIAAVATAAALVARRANAGVRTSEARLSLRTGQV